MTDINDIFEMENAKDTKQKPEKKSRKKKDYTEEEKQKIKERLKLGKVKAAEAREQQKKVETIENPIKKDIKPEETKQTPIEIREKLITKHILELEEADGIDPKELKQFLSKLYKASKQKHVQDAINNYDKPHSEPTYKQKDELEIKQKEIVKETPPKPKEPPKPSKEELEEKAYQERMAKLKKQLANKKRR